MRGMHMIRRLIVAAALTASLAGCGLTGPPALTVQPEQLPEGAVGEPYEVQITATWPDGRLVDDKSLHTEGSFPAGLQLRGTSGDDRTAAIVGTPTTAGTYEFTLFVRTLGCTMGGCPTGSRDYTLVVTP